MSPETAGTAYSAGFAQPARFDNSVFRYPQQSRNRLRPELKVKLQAGQPKVTIAGVGDRKVLQRGLDET